MSNNLPNTTLNNLKDNKQLIIIFSVVVVLLLSLGGVYYWITHKPSNTNNQANKVNQAKQSESNKKNQQPEIKQEVKMYHSQGNVLSIKDNVLVVREPAKDKKSKPRDIKILKGPDTKVILYKKNKQGGYDPTEVQSLKDIKVGYEVFVQDTENIAKMNAYIPDYIDIREK